MGQRNNNPDPSSSGTQTRKNAFEEPSSTMSLGDHLEELRHRIILAIAGVIVALVVSLFFSGAIISFIEKPFIEAMGKEARLQTLAPAEGIIIYMNIALIAGLVVSSPWVFYQLWMFVAAGLYPHERRYVHIAVPFSVCLFITGALLFIFYIAPVMLKFLILFNKEIVGVSSNFTFKNYISFITLMMLIFGLAFQTPIVVFVLAKTGLVPLRAFCKFRKYVILGIVVIAAAVLPGSDPFSLFALSIPMYLLYELGIFLSYISLRKKMAETNES
jgi:sec-independent protein translocase protein TatC